MAGGADRATVGHSRLEPLLTPHRLRARRLGVDTYRTPILYLRADCPICRSEGFAAMARVEVRAGDRSVIATLDVITSQILSPGEAGLSEEAWRQLRVGPGDPVDVRHAPVIESFRHVRGKMHGQRFTPEALHEIVQDLAAHTWPDLHVAAFLTACAGQNLDLDEITLLTQEMIGAGERLHWATSPVVDKHCVGGLPGNRTTPIVVAIVAAAGLTIPKTSSRSITSPAGTADVMDVLTDVDLDVPRIRAVVAKEGGCLAWGGAVRLSPVDDLLIRVEKALDIDGHGQLVASVLSKKAAAGSTHVLIDIPHGPKAKVRSVDTAQQLGRLLEGVGRLV
ncbi:MAG: thymidine phosphorylase, partial [Myxococcales bacterium]|nr:thymidine phosphorylase [Myxococcales bacterium]